MYSIEPPKGATLAKCASSVRKRPISQSGFSPGSGWRNSFRISRSPNSTDVLLCSAELRCGARALSAGPVVSASKPASALLEAPFTVPCRSADAVEFSNHAQQFLAGTLCRRSRHIEHLRRWATTPRIESMPPRCRAACWRRRRKPVPSAQSSGPLFRFHIPPAPGRRWRCCRPACPNPQSLCCGWSGLVAEPALPGNVAGKNGVFQLATIAVFKQRLPLRRLSRSAAPNRQIARSRHRAPDAAPATRIRRAPA